MYSRRHLIGSYRSARYFARSSVFSSVPLSDESTGSVVTKFTFKKQEILF